jgi:hypothetical protein
MEGPRGTVMSIMANQYRSGFQEFSIARGKPPANNQLVEKF